jgi:hypothetical protein
LQGAFLGEGIEGMLDRTMPLRLVRDNMKVVLSQFSIIQIIMNSLYERIHQVPPNDDAYIESFNFILEREVIRRRFEYKSFEEAESTIGRDVWISTTMRNCIQP